MRPTRPAPVTSAPEKKPCASRTSRSATGASTPATEAVGSNPTATVATPMPITVTSRTLRRPSLSPSRPSTMPPTGRIRNALPKMARTESKAAVALSAGKKSGPIMAAMYP
jgi:hypothetical protein